MHKSEKGDDVNITVAEGVSSTVRDSKITARSRGDIGTADRSIDINNSIEYDCVRISPSFMEFKDACEGMTFRQMFVIQNMGKHSAHVRICSPNSIAFQIETLRGGVFLSPGLRILRWVHYSYKRTSVLHAMIPIYINWKYIDYHVICTLAKASLSIEPASLDFGLVDIGSTSGIKTLTLKNDGGKSTRFAVDLGPNEMDLSVKPMRGIIQAHSKISIRVELLGVEEGSFFGEFWIKSTPNIQVPVKVNIILPRLVVYHPNTTGDFTLIDFPVTFTNTIRHDTIVLRSLSAQVSNFVVLAEIDNDLIPFKHINFKKHPAFQVFTIYPLEGRMDAFEGRVFNITFSPTVNVTTETEEFRKRDRQDFMVFVRIFRIHCTEVEDIVRKEMSMDDRTEEPFEKVQLLEPDSEDSLEIFDNEPPEPPGFETVRLCLYGETEKPRLDFIPSELQLGDIKIGEIVRRELTILNPSNSASVDYKFRRNSAAHCEPPVGRLKPQNSVQVLITITGNYNVKVPFKLAFDVVVQTCNLTTLKPTYTTAKPCWVLGWYNLIIPTGKDGRNKSPSDFVKNKSEDVDKLAGHSLCLNSEYALSPKEIEFRHHHRLYWSNYVRARRIEREKSLNRLVALSNTTDCEDLLTAKLPKMKQESMASKLLSKAMALKIVSKATDEMLVPLSPLQIYNVKIAPTVLAYGLVAPKTTNYCGLNIENLNDFPVMLRLVSRVSKAISFSKKTLIILWPGSQITKIVEYRAGRIGKFNTHIDYIINDNHSFAMTVTATVVLKSLNLNVREITFGNQYLACEAYQPLSSTVEMKNKLDASTKFTWDLRSNASFAIFPMSGTVRGNRTLLAEVCYEPIASKSNNMEAVLTSESGTRANVKLDAILKKPDVAFINDTLELDTIPLNMTTTTIGVIHNAEFSQVMFQIDQSSLIYGCEVSPNQGVIPPRGIVNLEVKLKFDTCFKFSIAINVMVQKSFKLELKLLGQVAYPKLKLYPETICIDRISADAFSTNILTASNTGNVIFKVQFPLEQYPEYRASLSPHKRDPGIDSGGFTIFPGASVSVYLHFIPIDLASYSFYLPIVINEILGPVLIENPKTLKPSNFLKSRELSYAHYRGVEITELPHTMPTVFIDCTVSGHVISFSKHAFHFDMASNKVKDDLRVFNKTNQEVSFIIRIDDFSHPTSPFSITWLCGAKPAITALSIVATLQPQEEIFFLIEFKPLEKGRFEIEAPIFVREELDGNMFNSLILDGINILNSIVCEKTELYFPPVPLTVEAEQKLTLKVGRCKSPFEIKAVVVKPKNCVGTYSDDCIRIKFLGSNLITGKNSNEELEVTVLFQSAFPVAFSTGIEFCVTEEIACCVKVHVIADNCIFTTYGFIKDTTELVSTAKQQERISFPSITSRGENSSSLIQQELIVPRKYAEAALTRLSLHSSVSTASQRSLKILEAKQKLNQIENEKSKDKEDDTEASPQLSNISGIVLPVSDQSSKFSKIVYPYYPMTSESDYMQRTFAAAEQWMYSAGLKFNFYPSIVDGITAVFSGVCSIASRASDKRKAHTVSQSFVDILVTLAGQDVLKYIGDISCIPEDPLERVSYILKLYDNVLEFLAVQGAFLPHVQSQFLLCYNDYLLNDGQDKSSTKDRSSAEPGKSIRSEKMPREMFQSRSKQCWLDVTLQTFKTLVLKRINLKNVQGNINSSCNQPDSSTLSSVSSAVSVLQYLANKPILKETTGDTFQYTTEETLLLSWLQHHFENQRLVGWMKDDGIYLNPDEKGDELESRTVSNFETDLADSLVLIAVTAAHCPYLINDHFKNIFISPRNTEEIHHNALCLTNAWRRIRLGFIISPNQIVKPICVQMVMLVVHLFHSLPTYLPSSKIQFCCPLIETVTRQISFHNTTEYPVSYVVEFIGNDTDLFNAVIPQPVVKLQARRSGSFKIRYHAKKIGQTKAYVILCGSSVAPNFARNQVFILEGCTSYLGITTHFNIERMLNKVCDETLKIPVPYKQAAEYDISVTEEQPTVPASLTLSRWADLKIRKVPRRLFLNQETIIVSENSCLADLSITIACIAPTKRSFWIVFESEIGDFIIQINSTWKKATTDYITVEWKRETCTCSDLPNRVSSNCPLNIKIPIPTRNVQLWDCVNEMFQKTLDPKECSFWSRHFDTNIGLRLIHWLMGDYHDSAAKEFAHIFNTSVTYNVATSDNENLIVPATLVINDVRPRGEETDMSVHILQGTPQTYETTIKLSAPLDVEYRTYKIDFLCTTPIPLAVCSSETNDQVKKKKSRR